MFRFFAKGPTVWEELPEWPGRHNAPLGTTEICIIAPNGEKFLIPLETRTMQDIATFGGLRDPLTGTQSRMGFQQEIAKATTPPVTIACLGITGLHLVNSQGGYEAGDLALIATGSILMKMIDGVARIGGDEFGLLLPETDYTTAHAIFLRILQRLPSCRIGAVTYTPPSINGLRAAQGLMTLARMRECPLLHYDLSEGVDGSPIEHPVL